VAFVHTLQVAHGYSRVVPIGKTLVVNLMSGAERRAVRCLSRLPTAARANAMPRGRPPRREPHPKKRHI